MADIVSQSSVAKGLKKTLSKIMNDPSDYEDKAQFRDVFDEEDMDDAFEDDQEYGFTGLAAETMEATEFPIGALQQGITTRYVARKIGLKMIITREARRDNKYPQIIQAAQRLTRALYKTLDITGGLVFARATNASYVGGDAVALASASHTLPGGGTFSNLMATPMAPSTIAISVMRAQARKIPGRDGTREGVKLKKIVFPVDQETAWEVLANSSHAPEAGQFNAVNIVQRMKLEYIGYEQWTNTTSNWGAITDAEDGLKWKWRDKPYSNTWQENSQELMFHQIAARFDFGWSNARGFLFSEA